MKNKLKAKIQPIKKESKKLSFGLFERDILAKLVVHENTFESVCAIEELKKKLLLKKDEINKFKFVFDANNKTTTWSAEGDNYRVNIELNEDEIQILKLAYEKINKAKFFHASMKENYSIIVLGK